jgi:hypothetical protein
MSEHKPMKDKFENVLGERHTIVITRELKAKIMRLSRIHKKDVNERIRERIEEEVNAELQLLEPESAAS